jgi:CRP-like cAMP-binding protein
LENISSVDANCLLVRNGSAAGVTWEQCDGRSATKGVALLAKHGWLSQTEPAFARNVLAACRWRRMEDGEVVSHPYLEGDAMFGVAEGYLVGEQHPLGSIDFALAVVWHVGSWVGFAPLLLGAERRGVIRARGEALVAVLPGQRMHELLATRPDWWREMARLPYIVSQLHAGGGQDLLRRDAGERCLAVLMMLAGCRWVDLPTEAPYVAPVSQQELGERCNLSRNGVIKALRPLAKAGLITLGYRQILLHDTQTLRALLTRSD